MRRGNYDYLSREGYPRPGLKMRSGDKFETWNMNPTSDKMNLSIKDANGETMLALFGLTKEMLTGLFNELATCLDHAPQATIAHLEELRKHLDQILGERFRDPFSTPGPRPGDEPGGYEPDMPRWPSTAPPPQEPEQP